MEGTEAGGRYLVEVDLGCTEGGEATDVLV